ncbi:ArnT family glycosyltransferase [Saccharopolyspora shandongensis]|uniref:ArnT family glycosyltransferase n=1 Tax=Saccharopolyspora shandongensis TaxID=418495 RepID=UPI0033F97D5E
MTSADSTTLFRPVAEAERQRATGWPQRLALTAICVLAGVLYCWGIGSSWGNTYYSAAVKSMSESFENFFFGSFDAAGVVTVDKPPMALWVQVLSVKVFGFNQFAVLFPQVVLGMAAVFVLHRTVRRWAGENAALLAALVLALTPITVMINRDNNPDTLLVLLVVAAAYAMTRSFESRKATGWVALAAFLVGCGFLTKMLQAWMVLPALVAAYLVGSRAGWGRRLLDIGVAAVVLVVSSFWWVVATELWPSPKPYISGSKDGSAWDLTLGYNGLGRIFGGSGGMRGSGGEPAAHGGVPVPDAGLTGGPGGGPGGDGFAGSSGVVRLFNGEFGGQISWLLPLCALVLAAMLVVGIRHRRAGRPEDRTHSAGWVLWGGWLVVIGLMFSFAQGIVHPYYTTMLAPAVGAVAGAGIVRFWRWYRRPAGKAWLLLPVGVAITVAWAMVIVARDLSWHAWAGYAAVVLGIVALVVLVIGRRGSATLAKSGLVLGLASALMVPTAWSAIGAVAVQDGMGGTNPLAGPLQMARGPLVQFPAGGDGAAQPPNGQGPDGSMQPGMAGDGQRPSGIPLRIGGPGDGVLTETEKKLLAYVEAHVDDVAVQLAVDGGPGGAGGYILNSDLAVVGMGGFSNREEPPTVEQLAAWKQSGQLGFVLLNSGLGGPPGQNGMPLPQGAGLPTGGGLQQGPIGQGGEITQARQEWVKQNCTLVDPASWGGAADTTVQLYSCK